jgi:hypothetical protein
MTSYPWRAKLSAQYFPPCVWNFFFTKNSYIFSSDISFLCLSHSFQSGVERPEMWDQPASLSPLLSVCISEKLPTVTVFQVLRTCSRVLIAMLSLPVWEHPTQLMLEDIQTCSTSLLPTPFSILGKVPSSAESMHWLFLVSKIGSFTLRDSYTSRRGSASVGRAGVSRPLLISSHR